MTGLRPAALFFAFVAAFLPAATTQAQDPHAVVQSSLVYLELEYTPSTGPMTGVQQSAQATGFFVSDDGFILTSYHLVEQMIATQGVNMKLTAFLGEPGSAFDFDAAIVNTLRPLDLMLVKIRPSNQVEYVPVTLGRSDQVGDDKQIFTSGFHGTEPFQLTGRIVNELGPAGIGYLWAVDLTVAAGQSGSPVYLADGTVVGMLKGVSNTAAGIGYMIPIQYADALIAHIRLSTIAGEIANLRTRLDETEKVLADLGAYYVWGGEFTSGGLVISYKKLIASGPEVKSIDYSLIPFLEQDDGETLRDTPLARGSSEIIVNANGKGGQVIIPGVDQLIRTKLSVTPNAARIGDLDVIVVPTTGGDEKLAPQTFRVEVITQQ